MVVNEMDHTSCINEMNNLKTIINCRNETIGELKENNKLLEDKISLTEKLGYVSTSFSAKQKHNKNNPPPNYEKNKSAIVTDGTQHQRQGLVTRRNLQFEYMSIILTKIRLFMIKKVMPRAVTWIRNKKPILRKVKSGRQWFEENLEGTKEQKLSMEQMTEKKKASQKNHGYSLGQVSHQSAPMFRIAAVNVQCLTNKKPLMELFLKKYNCHLFCVTEHWCNASNINLMQFEEYDIIANFTRKQSSCGGSLEEAAIVKLTLWIVGGFVWSGVKNVVQ
ncbi:hypothetical protein HHI36_005421 [Cryptolaemus montrouzieri]|uniref:Uncharacterized protein n=1 Tax=Cryptolaemus montrouzieri TaxID=559131 RepID=A0ABD2NUK4_9CUCU